jgi:hypothetical protein
MEKHELDSRTADQMLSHWREFAIRPHRKTWSERLLDCAVVGMWVLAFVMLIVVVWRLG